uniref:Uncharacterized protein n=1 Tax=Anguilla anguilla TaxID=7936 RepID=A0A0E9WQG5_ANGAN
MFHSLFVLPLSFPSNLLNCFLHSFSFLLLLVSCSETYVIVLKHLGTKSHYWMFLIICHSAMLLKPI